MSHGDKRMGIRTAIFQCFQHEIKTRRQGIMQVQNKVKREAMR